VGTAHDPMTLSAGARRQINSLSQAQPEAGPWLAVLEAALAEAADPVWDAAAATATLHPERTPGMPLLAGADIPVDRHRVDRWVRRLLALAGEAASAAIPLRAAAHDDALDANAILEAAINGDGNRLEGIAQSFGLDPETLGAVAPLAVMPLLQALRRRFGSAVDPRWSEGVCPVCGGWPTLAEQRGLERARRLRCGRCSGDWAQPGIRCPFCDMTGHQHRSALVAADDRESRRVETCAACRGYLKNISTLRAWAGDEVVLADLATIELDLVAVEREYERPVARPLTPRARLIA
jgi:FdhE protein